MDRKRLPNETREQLCILSVGDSILGSEKSGCPQPRGIGSVLRQTPKLYPVLFKWGAGIMRVDVSWNQLVLGSNYSPPLGLYEGGKLYRTR